MHFPRPGWALDARPALVLAAAVGLQWLSAITAAGWSRPREELADPAVLVNLLFVGPLALGAAFALARTLGGRALGAWTLLVWLAAPWLLTLFALPSYADAARDHVVPLVLGIDPDPGFAAGAAVLLAAALACVRRPLATAAAGVAAGGAVLLVPATVVFAVTGVAALALDRRPRLLAAALAGLAPGAAAALLRFGTTTADRSRDAFDGSMAGLREYFWSQRVLQWLPLAGAVAVARRSPPLALYLGGGVVAFAVAAAARTGIGFEEGELVRTLLPALPGYVLLCAALPLLIPTLATRLGEDAEPLPLRPPR